ncbi:MAG: DUF3606 domain-containing protein [Usitatibacter sp.]
MDDAVDYKELLAKERVNLRNAHEIELWTDALDIYTGDLVAAVAEVGDSAAKVFEHLHNKGVTGSRSRTPEPTPKPPSSPNKA